MIEEKIKNGTVAVLFTASWCGPCAMMKPEFERVKNYSTINMEMLDVDQYGNLAMELKIKAVPTLKIFKNGEEIFTKSGFMGERQIKELIDQI